MTPLAKANRSHVKLLNVITIKEKEIEEIKQEKELSQRAREIVELQIYDTKGWEFRKHKELVSEREEISNRLAGQEETFACHLIELSELQSDLQIANAKIVAIKLKTTENKMKELSEILNGAYVKFAEIGTMVTNLLKSNMFD